MLRYYYMEISSRHSYFFLRCLQVMADNPPGLHSIHVKPLSLGTYAVGGEKQCSAVRWSLGRLVERTPSPPRAPTPRSGSSSDAFCTVSAFMILHFWALRLDHHSLVDSPVPWMHGFEEATGTATQKRLTPWALSRYTSSMYQPHRKG